MMLSRGADEDVMGGGCQTTETPSRDLQSRHNHKS